jgi:hypothetical protein
MAFARPGGVQFRRKPPRRGAHQNRPRIGRQRSRWINLPLQPGEDRRYRVTMPELAPDEVLVAIMASSVNYNTVWSAMFEPIPTFRFLEQFARQGGWAARHNLPYQFVGVDHRLRPVRVPAAVR